MELHDFEKSLMYLIGLAGHLFAVSFNNELSGTGITLRQARVLSCLEIRGELAQNELAALLQIEPPTVARVLDRMERDGWIKRLSSPQDRRKKIIRSTKKAASKLKLIVEYGSRIEKHAVANLSKSQLDTMKELLKVVCKNLGLEKCNR
jgi:MarR family transcriptional regulator for hemolysin